MCEKKENSSPAAKLTDEQLDDVAGGWEAKDGKKDGPSIYPTVVSYQNSVPQGIIEGANILKGSGWTVQPPEITVGHGTGPENNPTTTPPPSPNP